MHNREQTVEADVSLLEQEIEPATFVLETVYKGERRIIADGVAFPPPNEMVVVSWRASGSTELIPSVESLYERFGDAPRVMWHHSSGILTESEPQAFIDSYQ
jgi:hypothetical protein